MTQAFYVSLLFAPGLVESQTGFHDMESEPMDLRTSADILAELIIICNFLVITSENSTENRNSLL